MNSMGRERGSHDSRLFLEVTPGIRRALELLAEASIALLDEIDAPDEDLEDGLDDEPSTWLENFAARSSDKCEDDDREPDLGWTNDGDRSGTDADDDFAAAESSSGLPRVTVSHRRRAAVKVKFDPRLALRPGPSSLTRFEKPIGLRLVGGTQTVAAPQAVPLNPPDRHAPPS